MNGKENTAITPESVLATIKEMSAEVKTMFAEAEKRSSKFDQALEKSREEFDRRMAESDARFKQSNEEYNRKMAASDARFEQRNEAFDRKFEKMHELMGSWTNNHGFFAEDYFFNSFENGQQNFFGEKFDEIKKNLKGIETDDEFDVVMLNGHSVGLIEVKFKAHENDLPKVLKKVHAFRTNFPKYQKHKVYLGLATMAFYPKLEEECIKEGIAVIKQLGDTIIINEEHLKAF